MVQTAQEVILDCEGTLVHEEFWAPLVFLGLQGRQAPEASLARPGPLVCLGLKDRLEKLDYGGCRANWA